MRFFNCIDFQCMNKQSKIKIRIKENSLIAKIAAKRLGFSYVAIVIGRTIHLHNTDYNTFLNRKSWVLHELKHVEQFSQHGFFQFVLKYYFNYLKNGYYLNVYEVEARAAENDETLLTKYELIFPKI